MRTTCQIHARGPRIGAVVHISRCSHRSASPRRHWSQSHWECPGGAVARPSNFDAVATTAGGNRRKDLHRCSLVGCIGRSSPCSPIRSQKPDTVDVCGCKIERRVPGAVFHRGIGSLYRWSACSDCPFSGRAAPTFWFRSSAHRGTRRCQALKSRLSFDRAGDQGCTLIPYRRMTSRVSSLEPTKSVPLKFPTRRPQHR